MSVRQKWIDKERTILRVGYSKRHEWYMVIMPAYYSGKITICIGCESFTATQWKRIMREFRKLVNGPKPKKAGAIVYKDIKIQRDGETLYFHLTPAGLSREMYADYMASWNAELEAVTLFKLEKALELYEKTQADKRKRGKNESKKVSADKAQEAATGQHA